MKYYYFKILKHSQGFGKDGDMDLSIVYWGSLKRVQAKSKSHANSILKARYQTVPFKLVNQFRAKKLWRKRKKWKKKILS